MLSFKEWLILKEKNDGLWMKGAPRIEPGTKRQNVKDLYNHRYTGTNAVSVPVK